MKIRNIFSFVTLLLSATIFEASKTSQVAQATAFRTQRNCQDASQVWVGVHINADKKFLLCDVYPGAKNMTGQFASGGASAGYSKLSDITQVLNQLTKSDWDKGIYISLLEDTNAQNVSVYVQDSSGNQLATAVLPGITSLPSTVNWEGSFQGLFSEDSKKTICYINSCSGSATSTVKTSIAVPSLAASSGSSSSSSSSSSSTTTKVGDSFVSSMLKAQQSGSGFTGTDLKVPVQQIAPNPAFQPVAFSSKPSFLLVSFLDRQITLYNTGSASAHPPVVNTYLANYLEQLSAAEWNQGLYILPYFFILDESCTDGVRFIDKRLITSDMTVGMGIALYDSKLEPIMVQQGNVKSNVFLTTDFSQGANTFTTAPDRGYASMQIQFDNASGGNYVADMANGFVISSSLDTSKTLSDNAMKYGSVQSKVYHISSANSAAISMGAMALPAAATKFTLNTVWKGAEQGTLRYKLTEFNQQQFAALQKALNKGPVIFNVVPDLANARMTIYLTQSEQQIKGLSPMVVTNIRDQYNNLIPAGTEFHGLGVFYTTPDATKPVPVVLGSGKTFVVVSGDANSSDNSGKIAHHGSDDNKGTGQTVAGAEILIQQNIYSGPAAIASALKSHMYVAADWSTDILPALKAKNLPDTIIGQVAQQLGVTYSGHSSQQNAQNNNKENNPPADSDKTPIATLVAIHGSSGPGLAAALKEAGYTRSEVEESGSFKRLTARIKSQVISELG